MRPTGAALLLTILGRAAPAAPGPDPNDLTALREDARVAMKPCGRCHDAAQKSAVPAALEKFDLDQVDWASALTESKLRFIRDRFADAKMTGSERLRVETYLTAEWARRAVLPPEVRNRERAP